MSDRLAEALLAPGDLLKPDEVARRLRSSVKAVKADTDAGRLPYVLIGKRRRYDPADVAAYIEARKHRCSTSTKGRSKGKTAPSRPSGMSASRGPVVVSFAEASALLTKQRRG